MYSVVGKLIGSKSSAEANTFYNPTLIDLVCSLGRDNPATSA